MALNKLEQLNNLIDNAHYILVAFSNANDVDSACSALAWKNFLEKRQKQVDMVCSNFVNPKNLKFLKQANQIKPALTHLQKFTIKLDVKDTKIDSLSYDIKDGWLSIHINPKKGTISKNELRTAQSNFKYDLIITVNTPDLESLGEIFTSNTDLFYRLPIINLDHNIDNEHYGQVNWVELTATSTAENIFKLIKQIDTGLVDEELATILLTGIISQTKSFKTANITPYTLSIASELMELGANREIIVRHLYQSRSISSLKIWGQALTHLQTDKDSGLVWTTITRDNFIRSQVSESELSELIDELISNAPEAKIILILYEKPSVTDKIFGLLVSNNNTDAQTLVYSYQKQGSKKRVLFTIENKTLAEAEKKVVEDIKKQLNG